MERSHSDVNSLDSGSAKSAVMMSTSTPVSWQPELSSSALARGMSCSIAAKSSFACSSSAASNSSKSGDGPLAAPPANPRLLACIATSDAASLRSASAKYDSSCSRWSSMEPASLMTAVT